MGIDAKLQDDALRDKFSLDLDLVAENKDDARIAELMQFSTVECELQPTSFDHSAYVLLLLIVIVIKKKRLVCIFFRLGRIESHL